MPLSKRLFDIVLTLLIGGLLIPVAILITIVVLLADGRPVFHVSERMKGPGQSFSLWKFRTMRPAVSDSGVSGGDKQDRVTRLGRFLRRSRLDELPQLWNVLRGDMSLVGPRPPLRTYVERFPELYAEVLQSRPGITGLATLLYHKHEERLLSRCRSASETDATYARRCVPRKARIDLIYRDNRSFCFDLMILLRTFGRLAKRG